MPPDTGGQPDRAPHGVVGRRGPLRLDGHSGNIGYLQVNWADAAWHGHHQPLPGEPAQQCGGGALLAEDPAVGDTRWCRLSPQSRSGSGTGPVAGASPANGPYTTIFLGRAGGICRFLERSIRGAAQNDWNDESRAGGVPSRHGGRHG